MELQCKYILYLVSRWLHFSNFNDEQYWQAEAYCRQAQIGSHFNDRYECTTCSRKTNRILTAKHANTSYTAKFKNKIIYILKWYNTKIKYFMLNFQLVTTKEYTRLRSPGSRRDDLKQGHGQNLTRQSSWIFGLLLFYLLSFLTQWTLL